MVFTRFVEAGRIVLITKGANADKIAVIVEIIDQNRAIIEGPTTGVERQAFPYHHLSLTALKIDLPRGARSSTVKKVFEATKVVEQWNATSTAKRLATKKIRANLNDFERFKVMVLKRKRCALLKSA